MSPSLVLLSRYQTKGDIRLSPPQIKEQITFSLKSGLIRCPEELKGVVLDFGSLYPGDFQGEEFLKEGASALKGFLHNFIEALRSLELRVKVSFTGVADKGPLKEIFAHEDESFFEKRALSLSHLNRWHREGLLALGVNHLLELFENLTAFGGSQEGALSLVSLWGNVEKVGSQWVPLNTTLSEIYELKGAGEARLSFLLIDGPSGQIHKWQEIKEKSLKELAPQVRTLHFMTELKKEVFSKDWNEFFKHDQCLECLPCHIVREQMKGHELTSFFKGKAPYGCDFPTLYLKGKEIQEEYFLNGEGIV